MKTRIKIINVINIVLSCVALILSAMPSSVKLTEYNGEQRFVTYTSYFISPLNFLPFLVLTVAILIIICLLLFGITAIRNNKLINIISMSVSTLAFVVSLLILILARGGTVYNVLIMLLFLILIALNAVKLWELKRTD